MIDRGSMGLFGFGSWVISSQHRLDIFNENIAKMVMLWVRVKCAIHVLYTLSLLTIR